MATVAALVGLSLAPTIIGAITGGNKTVAQAVVKPPPPAPSALDSILSILPYILAALAALGLFLYLKK